MNKNKFYEELERLNSGDKIEDLTWDELNKLSEKSNFNSFIIERNNGDDTWAIQVTEFYLNNH